MGCCVSRSTGPNSPYPGGAPNTSARHINPPPLSLPESVQFGQQPRGVTPSRVRNRHTQSTSEQQINKPLQRHVWTATSQGWTRDSLDRERRDFFDTRVTGRAEIWQALHAAVTVLWVNTSLCAGDNSVDSLGTAQAILTAAEISLPTGNLVNGAYDSLGNYYSLPDWVISDPQNLIDREPDCNEDEETVSGRCRDIDQPDSNERNLEIDAREKGKYVLDASQQVQLRARLSDSGNDVLLSVNRTENVKVLVEMIGDNCSLTSTKRIRLAYMGKMLKENSTLEAQGWIPGHVVNALVFPNR